MTTPPRSHHLDVVLIIAVVMLLMVSVMGLNCGCVAPLPSANDDTINTSKDLQVFVERSVYNWLSPRLSIDESDLKTFKSRRYLQTTDLQHLIGWFQDKMIDSQVWDMRRLIAQIMTSELYDSDPPSEHELYKMILKSLTTYEHYDEEDHDQD